jgi:hypothetical protein
MRRRHPATMAGLAAIMATKRKTKTVDMSARRRVQFGGRVSRDRFLEWHRAPWRERVTRAVARQHVPRRKMERNPKSFLESPIFGRRDYQLLAYRFDTNGKVPSATAYISD